MVNKHVDNGKFPTSRITATSRLQLIGTGKSRSVVSKRKSASLLQIYNVLPDNSLAFPCGFHSLEKLETANNMSAETSYLQYCISQS